MTAKILDLETEKARRMQPVKFSTVAEHERKVMVSIDGCFSPAAARILAHAILARADAVESQS